MGLAAVTFWRDVDTVQDAERWLGYCLLNPSRRPASHEEWFAIYAEYVRRKAEAWKPSTRANPSSRPANRPELDDLTAVQAAIFKVEMNLTYNEIAERLGLKSVPHESYDRRRRSNSAINHVTRGKEILACRKYSFK